MTAGEAFEERSGFIPFLKSRPMLDLCAMIRASGVLRKVVFRSDGELNRVSSERGSSRRIERI